MRISADAIRMAVAAEARKGIARTGDGESPLLLAGDRDQRRMTHRVQSGVSRVEADAVAALSGLADPALLMGAVQAGLRRVSNESKVQGVQAKKDEVELAEQKREEALEEAKKAAEEASGFLGLSKELGLIIEIAAVVAGAASAVVTGGAALAVAGAVLVLLGDEIVEFLTEQGVIPEEAAPFVAAALKLVGSIMMGGAGSAGAVSGTASTASSTAQATSTVAEVAQAAKTAAQLASAGATIADGAVNIAAASCQKEEANFRADAEGFETASEIATDEMADEVDDLKTGTQGLRRAMGRLRDIVEAQDEARRAARQILA